jgi:hypothetical protein
MKIRSDGPVFLPSSFVAPRQVAVFSAFSGGATKLEGRDIAVFPEFSQAQGQGGCIRIAVGHALLNRSAL